MPGSWAEGLSLAGAPPTGEASRRLRSGEPRAVGLLVERWVRTDKGGLCGATLRTRCRGCLSRCRVREGTECLKNFTRGSATFCCERASFLPPGAVTGVFEEFHQGR